METVTLGMTDLKVSRIAFGAWELGGEWGSFDENAAIATIRHARERGITLFDTAQAYGFGASERILGRALRDDLDRRREEVVIATKGGLRMTAHRAGTRFEPRLAPTGRRGQLASARRRLHRSVPGALARPERCPGRDRRRPRRARPRGQDPTCRRLELRRRGDGRVRADTAGGNAPAAVQLVSSGHRDRRVAVHPHARHRRARLRTAGPRIADREHGRTNDVRPRRLAQHEPLVPRRDLPRAISRRYATSNASPQKSSAARSRNSPLRGRSPTRRFRSRSSVPDGRSTSTKPSPPANCTSVTTRSHTSTASWPARRPSPGRRPTRCRHADDDMRPANQFVDEVREMVVPRRAGRHGPLPPLLLGLTLVTGLVDAFSYLLLGHVFVANMTGNVVFLGFAIAGATGFSIPASLVALGSFVCGALIGGKAGSATGASPRTPARGRRPRSKCSCSARRSSSPR